MSGNINPGGIYPGYLYPGGLQPGVISGVYMRAYIRGGFYPGDLKSTLTIFKDSTCFTRAKRARAFAANK